MSSYQSILERECGYNTCPPPRTEFFPKLEPVLQKGTMAEHLGVDLAPELAGGTPNEFIEVVLPVRPRRIAMLPGDRPHLHPRDHGPDGA